MNYGGAHSYHSCNLELSHSRETRIATRVTVADHFSESRDLANRLLNGEDFENEARFAGGNGPPLGGAPLFPTPPRSAGPI